MKTPFILFILFVCFQSVSAQGITMTKVIDGKKYTVTPSTKVYDSTGQVVPFDKWFSLIGTYDLVPIPLKGDEEQTFRLKRFSDEAIAKQKQENEARRAALNANPIITGNPIRPFSVVDIEGKKWSSAELSGKVIVLNYWFVNCAPCIKEMPELNALKQSYAQNEDVVFISVNPVDTKESVAAFLKTKQFDFAHITKEQSSGIKESMGIGAFPSYLIIDRNGMINYFSQGYSTQTMEILKEQIKKVMSK